MTPCPYCATPLVRVRQSVDDPTGWPSCPIHGDLDDLDLRPHLVAQEATPMNPTTPDPLLVSVAEACRRLGLTHRTVTMLMDSGELRTVQGKKRRYVYAVDVTQYAQPKHGAA